MIEGRQWMRTAFDQARSVVEMVVDPHTRLENIYRRFGPVSTLGVGSFRYVYLLGPDANRFVIGHSELFGWREAFDPLAVVDGETAPWQQWQRLGTPAWRRAVAARQAVAQRVRAEIQNHRSQPDDDRQNVLALLVGSQDEDGSGLTDVEIVDQVISLIAAGYETTSAAMGWAVHAALADPEVWQQA